MATTITKHAGGVRIMEGSKLLGDYTSRPDTIKQVSGGIVMRFNSEDVPVSTTDLEINTGTGAVAFSGTAAELSLKLMNEVFFLTNALDAPDWIKSFQALGSAIKGTTIGADWRNAGSGVALADAQARFAAMWVPKSALLTGLGFQIITQGNYTADQTNQLGLYSFSGTTLTRLAVSANNGNLWKAAAGIAKEPFTAPVQVSAGLYFGAILWNASATTTAPAINSQASDVDRLPAFDFPANILTWFHITAVANSLPATVDLTTQITTNNNNHFLFPY